MFYPVITLFTKKTPNFGVGAHAGASLWTGVASSLTTGYCFHKHGTKSGTPDQYKVGIAHDTDVLLEAGWAGSSGR